MNDAPQPAKAARAQALSCRRGRFNQSAALSSRLVATRLPPGPEADVNQAGNGMHKGMAPVMHFHLDVLFSGF